LFLSPVWTCGHFNITSVLTEVSSNPREKILVLFKISSEANGKFTVIRRIQTPILYKADQYRMSSYIWNGNNKFLLYDCQGTLSQHHIFNSSLEGKKFAPKWFSKE